MIRRKPITANRMRAIALKAIAIVAAWYPEDVFPGTNKSFAMKDTELVTAISGRAARLTAESIRTVFYSLVMEEQKKNGIKVRRRKGSHGHKTDE